MTWTGVIGWDLGLAALALALAGVIRGFSGFGSAMMTVPIFSLLFGPVQAVATVAVLEAVVTVQLLPRALGQASWRDVLLLSATACPVIPLANRILLTTDPDFMRRVIAVLVILFALVMLAGWRYRGRRHPAATLGVGALTGALIGFAGMAAPVVVLYLLSGPDGAARNRANIIVFFTAIVAVLLASLWLQGGIVAETAWRSALLAPVFIATTFVGARFFGHASEALFRRAVLYFLVVVGVVTFVL